MSGDDNHRTFSGIDTSRRSFLQKGAIASSAIALGGTTVGCVSAEQHEGENDAENGDYVLMLYPDAVEGATATVVSDEVDWHPWDDDVDDENQDEQDYRTHLVEFDFSASHVAPVFVPDDVEIDVEEDINLGEIRDLLHGPDDPIDDPVDDDGIDDDIDDEPDDDIDDDVEPDDDPNIETQSIGENGEAVLVEIALEDDPVDDDDDIEEPDDDIDDEPDDDIDDDVEPDDDPMDDENGPDDEPDTDDNDGLLNI